MNFRPHWITVPRQAPCTPPVDAQQDSGQRRTATRIGPGELAENTLSDRAGSPAEGHPSPSQDAGLDQIQCGVVRIHSYGQNYSFLTPHQQAPPQQSIGSGVVIPLDRLRSGGQKSYFVVLTCEHTVRGSSEVSVVLPMRGKSEIPARILSLCQELDLALLGFELDHKYTSFVQALPLGDSDQLRQGQPLRAYGFPLGQKSLKVTDGVYSGYQSGFIMHSSPISPGNSGGPLFDENHKVVGINRAIDSRSNASNVGYAVPISHLGLLLDGAPPLPPQLPPPGPAHVVKRHTLGVSLQATTTALADLTGCRSACGRQGVRIRFLYNLSPLRSAGVEVGDLLVAVDGQPVDKKGEMAAPWDAQKVSIIEYLERKKNSDQVELQVWQPRTRECIRLRSPLVDVNCHSLRSIYPPHEKIEYETCAGLTVMPLCQNHMTTEQLHMLFVRLTPEQQQRPHLVVTDITAGTRTFQSEIFRGGELLTHVNGQPVETIQEYRAALRRPVRSADNKFYLDLETDQHRRLVLRLETVVEEELKAAKRDLWTVDEERLVAWGRLLNGQQLAHVDEEDE